MNNIDLNRLVEPSFLKELHKLNPYRSIFFIFLLWVTFTLIVVISINFSSNFLILTFLFLAMGFFHNALISWIHEASHCNIFRNRRWNNAFADIFLCGPVGQSLDQYQWHHLEHHKHLGDPHNEIVLYSWTSIRGKLLLYEIVKYLTGFQAAIIVFRPFFSTKLHNLKKPPKISILGGCSFSFFNLFLFYFYWHLGLWNLYFLLWVIPLFTLGIMIPALRTIAEHQDFNFEPKVSEILEMPPITRTFRCSFIERFLVAPVGFYYHFEHHAYPAIPHYNLPKLRLAIEESNTEYYVGSMSYIGTIKKLCNSPHKFMGWVIWIKIVLILMSL